MQPDLADQTPLRGEVVIAVDVVIEQGETLDDELAVVGDASADVPRMVLVEKITFNLENHIHRLEDDPFSPVFSQRDFRDITVAKSKLEVPMGVAVPQGEHGVELLKMVIREDAIEITIFNIAEVIVCKTFSPNLVGQVETMLAWASLIANVTTVATFKTAVKGKGRIGVEPLGTCVIAFKVESGPHEPLCIGSRSDESDKGEQ